MTSDEAEELLGIVQRIGPVVLSTTVNPAPDLASALRRCVGMMIADYNMIYPATFASAFAIILDLARNGNATLVTMDRVRKAALAETPVYPGGTSTVLAIVRLTLSCEARIISTMTFVSRDQVEAVATSINDAFSQAEEVASDDLDAGTYMAILALHGTVVKQLADRGRQLPRVISYSYSMVMPALRMAQLAYANPSRYQELINENSVVHPAFMPRVGQMLAV
jgi:hypothetical protein